MTTAPAPAHPDTAVLAAVGFALLLLAPLPPLRGPPRLLGSGSLAARLLPGAPEAIDERLRRRNPHHVFARLPDLRLEGHVHHLGPARGGWAQLLHDGARGLVVGPEQDARAGAGRRAGRT